MAIKIEFDGWISDVKNFDWGTVVVVSHDQRAQNAVGEWETVGKDYLDVTVTAEQLQAIGEDKLIRVSGNLKASAYAKNDGSMGVNLKVRAIEVSPIKRNTQAPAATVTGTPGWDLPAVAEDVPF